MTPKLRIGLELAGVVLALMAVAAYVSSREDRIRMDATISAQKTVLDQYAKDRSDHEKQDAARDAQTAAAIQTMQSAVDKLKTPAQMAQWIPQQISTPQPFTINIPPATKESPKPDAVATIPQADLPAIRDAIEHCKECDVKLATATADVASRDAQMKLADAQIKALKTERDSAIDAAKGGNWIQRLKRNAKYLIIGAIAGAIAAKAHP